MGTIEYQGNTYPILSLVEAMDEFDDKAEQGIHMAVIQVRHRNWDRTKEDGYIVAEARWE